MDTVAMTPAGSLTRPPVEPASVDPGRTAAELRIVCACLEQYLTRLRAELAAAEDLARARLLRDEPAFDGDAGIITLADHLHAGVVLADEALELRSHVDLEQVDPSEHRHGQCHQCGRPIAPERLHALPTATLCLPCEQLD